MLDELRAFVEVGDAGSIVRAADRVFRTPSAVTRKIQRLEAALDAELLDRSVKPPRLTPIGLRILDQARDLLKRVDEMRASASVSGTPRGSFRLGLSQALADADIAAAIGTIPRKFPEVTVKLVSDLTPILFERLQRGELDAALALLPTGRAPPPPLTSTILATDEMVPVAARGLVADGDRSSVLKLGRYPWILNPPGCLLRASLIDELQAGGVPIDIAAEVHNPHVQLALVSSGIGIGLLPSRFVRRHARAREIVPLRPSGFRLGMEILLVRGGALGSLDLVVADLRDSLTTKEPAKRRST